MAAGSVYDFEVNDIHHQRVLLTRFRDTVLLIVNVASKCGFTPQYKGLEELFRKHKARRFSVLGFPCNQFGLQEPAPEAEIKAFCESNYGITFPLFAKIEVNGDGAHPLYEYLKSRSKGIFGSKAIKWNFTKFLVNRQGQVVERFPPSADPVKIEAQLVKYL